MKPKPNANILILGSGIAGISAALKLAKNFEVTLVSKSFADEGATRYAQGGIASVWSSDDTFLAHKQDTLTAGAGLCSEDVVELCVEKGPALVKELIQYGVSFTKQHESSEKSEVYDLHREAGHGARRILHADDLTGLAIESTLLKLARANPNIKILENHAAIDLITEGKILKSWRKPGRCLGAYVLNEVTHKIETLISSATVLATGGAGKVYLYTSNPDVATGDGIAMAHRAGAKISNLEFMQFHPTCLYHPNAKNFLISEALRGEGAVLVNAKGEDFSRRTHPDGSLAPRDIVARAIDFEMKRTGARHVYLDATRINAEDLKKKFPNIFERCHKFGIDMTRDPIPVVPAAHYMCGGVKVDRDGRTTIEGLYAIGEVSCTGLHGANRLASNSLLEAVVFADQVVRSIPDDLKKMGPPSSAQAMDIPQWDSGKAVKVEEQIDIAALWLEIRTLMWNYVGIVRSNQRIENARRRLALLKSEVDQYYWNYLLTRDLIELRNIHCVSELVVQCASLRKESRGLHYTVDYPDPESQPLKFTDV